MTARWLAAATSAPPPHPSPGSGGRLELGSCLTPRSGPPPHPRAAIRAPSHQEARRAEPPGSVSGAGRSRSRRPTASSRSTRPRCFSSSPRRQVRSLQLRVRAEVTSAAAPLTTAGLRAAAPARTSESRPTATERPDCGRAALEGTHSLHRARSSCLPMRSSGRRTCMLP
jgi:hypothetical protein